MFSPLILIMFCVADKVPANVVQDSFSFLSEEDAIAEITKDVDFSRKFCKEKRLFLNPNAK